MASENSQVENAASRRPAQECAKRAQKCLLRHVFGTTAIPAETVCEVDQRPLPPSNDPFKRRRIASQHAFNIRPISSALTGTYRRQGQTDRRSSRLHFLNNQVSVIKMQPSGETVGLTVQNDSHSEEGTS